MLASPGKRWLDEKAHGLKVGKEKKLENEFTCSRTASWLTGMVFSLETLCAEHASVPTRCAGASARASLLQNVFLWFFSSDS